MIVALTEDQAEVVNAAYTNAGLCDNCREIPPTAERAVLADVFTNRAEDTLKKNCLSVKFLCRLCALAIDQALSARRG